MGHLNDLTISANTYNGATITFTNVSNNTYEGVYTVVEGENVYVDADEIRAFATDHPQPFNRDEYLGQYADTHPEDTEPYLVRSLVGANHRSADARSTVACWDRFLPPRDPVLKHVSNTAETIFSIFSFSL